MPKWFGLIGVLRPGKQFFSHVETEPSWVLLVLWEGESAFLKDTTQRSWGSNSGPLGPESDALPLSHRASICRNTLPFLLPL